MQIIMQKTQKISLIALDIFVNPLIILRASGFGLRASGFGLRASGFGLHYLYSSLSSLYHFTKTIAS
jgi:hypothetical protein